MPSSALAPAFATFSGEITNEKIGHDLGLNPSEVSAWVTHADPYPDYSGYKVFFAAETPQEIRDRFPRMTPNLMLIVLAT